MDLGCGTGAVGLVLAPRGYGVDAVDPNPEAVRCARINALLNRCDGVIDVCQGDLFAPVADKQYDLITFSPPNFRGVPTAQFDVSWRAVDVFERFAAGLPGALKSDGVACVLQTSHGDESGMLSALLGTGLTVDVAARKHFGVEWFSVYRLVHTRP